METLKEVIKKYDDELELILNYHEVELISKINNVQQRSRAESIRDILNDLKNLPNESETGRDNKTKYGSCKGCKYYPRHLLRTVCAECDDWENYELIQ